MCIYPRTCCQCVANIASSPLSARHYIHTTKKLLCSQYTWILVKSIKLAKNQIYVYIVKQKAYYVMHRHIYSFLHCLANYFYCVLQPFSKQYIILKVFCNLWSTKQTSISSCNVFCKYLIFRKLTTMLAGKLPLPSSIGKYSFWFPANTFSVCRFAAG